MIPYSPGCHDKVDQTRLLPEEEGAVGVHLPRELLELVAELPTGFLQPSFVGHRLELEEAMEGGDDPAGAEVGPDAGPRAVIRVPGKQARAVVGVGVLQELADDGALEQRLVVVLQSRDQAARVELQQRVRLVVGIDLDVLVGNLLLLQDGPCPLDEWAATPTLGSALPPHKTRRCLQPAGVQLQWLLRLMSIDRVLCRACRHWV